MKKKWFYSYTWKELVCYCVLLLCLCKRFICRFLRNIDSSLLSVFTIKANVFKRSAWFPVNKSSVSRAWSLISDLR